MGKKSAPRKFLKILYWLETLKNYLSRGESGWKCPCAQVDFSFYFPKMPFYSKNCPFILPFIFTKCLFFPGIALLFPRSALIFQKLPYCLSESPFSF